MTGLIILDVVIGLIFIFLLLSLFATIINEWIAQWTSLRAKTLRRGVSELLGDTRLQQILTAADAKRKWEQGKAAIADPVKLQELEQARTQLQSLTSAFYKHPLIDSLKKGLSEPAYLSSAAFARTIIDLMRDMVADAAPASAAPGQAPPQAPAPPVPGSAELPSTDAIIKGFAAFNAEALTTLEMLKKDQLLSDDDAKKIAEVLDGTYLTKVATTLMQGAKMEIADLERRLGAWFDEGMERVSGWYKRYLQYIGLAVGFAIALAVNADAINMTTVLSREPVMRAALVQSATEAAKNCKSAADCPALEVATTLRNKSGLLPIGWDRKNLPFYCWKDGKETSCGTLETGGQILLWLLGLIATALAMTLGAPFWFDLLKKLVNLRSSGLVPGMQRNR